MGRSFSLLLLFLPIPSSSPPPFSGVLCWFPSPGCFSGSYSHRNRRCLFSHQHPDWQCGKDGSWLKSWLFGLLICVLGKWTDIPIQWSTSNRVQILSVETIMITIMSKSAQRWFCFLVLTGGLVHQPGENHADTASSIWLQWSQGV